MKVEEIADKYIREQYIDYGDLNDTAEIQIKDAVIFGLTYQECGMTPSELLAKYKEAVEALEKWNALEPSLRTIFKADSNSYFKYDNEKESLRTLSIQIINQSKEVLK